MLHVNRSLTPACYDFSLPRFRILLESRKASGSRNTFKRLGASRPVIYLGPHVTGLLAQLRLNLHPPGYLRSADITCTHRAACAAPLQLQVPTLSRECKRHGEAANASGTARAVRCFTSGHTSPGCLRSSATVCTHRAACAAPLKFAVQPRHASSLITTGCISKMTTQLSSTTFSA